ncbi:MAG: hypothetical protein WKF83_13330 [Nocardioidaceae bacterium]
MFDDTLLDDPDALLAADTELRRIAESGARVRRETDAAAEQLTMLDNTSRPVRSSQPARARGCCGRCSSRRARSPSSPGPDLAFLAGPDPWTWS